MTDDLVAFIGACVDEDERVALACRDEEFWGPGEDVPAPARRHIARHDPARVLAEVRAKREILRRHEPVPVAVGFEHNAYAACQHDDDRWPCADVLSLARPYAGRPGWRPEWATEVTA